MAARIIRRTLLVLSAAFGSGWLIYTFKLAGRVNRVEYDAVRASNMTSATYFAACAGVCLGIAGIIQVLERRIEKKLGQSS